MDIRQLRYFVAIAELESFTSAAEHLGVTQPALGSQMKNLESSLSTKLVERHSRGITLTEAGQRLKIHADDVLDRIRRIEDDIRRFSSTPSGTIKIGITPSLGRALVPRILEICADRFPDISVQFVQGFTDQLDHWITAKELNLAVTRAAIDSAQHETVPLYIETIKLFGHPSLVAHLSEPISLEVLTTLPLALDERSQHVRKVLDEGLAEAKLELRDILEIQAINIRREFVLQGKRCTLAPMALFSAEMESNQLIAKSVDLPGFRRTLHLAGPRVERMTPAELAVQEIIIKLMDEIIESGSYGWSLPHNS